MVIPAYICINVPLYVLKYKFSAYLQHSQGFKGLKYAPQDFPRMLMERSQGMRNVQINTIFFPWIWNILEYEKQVKMCLHFIA